MPIEIKFDIPENLSWKEKLPGVIGAPGFVRPLEGRRVEAVLETLSSQNKTIGSSFIYNGIKSIPSQNGAETIICNFSLDGYVNNLAEAISMTLSNPNVNPSRIGIFASSISGAVSAYFLAQNPKFQIRSIAFISPLVGWNYYGTAQQREFIKKLREENKISPSAKNSFIPITTKYDIQRDIKRYIPIECLDELEKIDGINALDNYRNQSIKVMTFIGEKDDVASPDSMINFHRKLGGGDETYLLKYHEHGHAIPIEDIMEPALEFFKKTLAE